MQPLALNLSCLSLVVFLSTSFATPSPEDDRVGSLNWCSPNEQGRTPFGASLSGSEPIHNAYIGRFKNSSDQENEYSLAFGVGNHWVPSANLYVPDSLLDVDSLGLFVDPAHLKPGVDLQWLCDTDEIVHRFIEVADPSDLPAFNLVGIIDMRLFHPNFSTQA